MPVIRKSKSRMTDKKGNVSQCLFLAGLTLGLLVFAFWNIHSNSYVHVDSLLLLHTMSSLSNETVVTTASAVTPPQTCQNKYATSTLLDRIQILHTIQHVYQEQQKMLTANTQTTAEIKKAINFGIFGQALLEKAMERNQFLLSVQIGAMDGISNDPLWEMFVGLPRRPTKFQKPLSHWIPVAIEPVPANFASLQTNYQKLQQTKELPCSLLMQGAVSYDHTPTDSKTCPFCRFDVDSKLEKCTNKPDWKRYQLGTLDCEYSRKYFNVDFDDCIIQDPLPCLPIDEILSKWHIPQQSIAMLQIDVEGYEAVLLPKLLQSTTTSESLPPVIHFEHKVMAHLDKRNGTTTRKEDTSKLLEEYGYTLFDQGEDMLALLHVQTTATTTKV